MAAFTVCDSCPDDKFVPATAHVAASRKVGAEVSEMRGKDTCDEHLPDTVANIWSVSHKAEKFHEVTVRLVPGRKKS